MYRLSIALFSLTLAACSSGTNPVADVPDSGLPPDGDGGTMVDPPEFEFEIVAGEGSMGIFGDNATMAIASNGEPVLAYGVVPSGSATRQIHFAERSSDGSWTTELVVEPGANAPGGGDLVGLGLAVVAGTPHVVYQGGDDDGNVLTPFPTDLMLSTKSGAAWTESTLADASGEAAGPCKDSNNYCAFGNVVGTHASITANPNGNGYAVVYRDTHAAFARDDFALSDVEVYVEGGPVGHVLVDAERSGGAYSSVGYSSGGAIFVIYNIEEEDAQDERVGVWAATWDGTEWQRRRLSESQTAARTSAVATANGIHAAFYDVDNSDLLVASSTDDGDTWDVTPVDTRGRTGLHPDIAVDDQGRLVVSYTYCGPQSDSDCPGSLGGNSEVRLARLEGSEWKTYVVDDGEGLGNVGLFTNIVSFSDGKLGVSFQNSRNNDLIFTREQ